MEIHDMADADLVKAVAVEVMGWKHHNHRGELSDETRFVTTQNGMLVRGNGLWSPLADWDDAMMVRKAMQARGCSVSLIDHDSFSGEVRAGEDVYVDCTPETEMRALLEACLAAARKGGA